ncbi:hypothetical protein KAU92_02140 [Candidatus Bathyarchaeota archaeon]|nr:hypothetical protein [Candidatus Bathyarchaeota archaeon]
MANHAAIPSSRRKEKASKTEKLILAVCGLAFNLSPPMRHRKTYETSLV